MIGRKGVGTTEEIVCEIFVNIMEATMNFAIFASSMVVVLFEKVEILLKRG